MVMQCILAFVTGVNITLLSIFLKKPFGYFKIDSSDPDKDVYRLCLEKPITKQKFIILKIERNVDLSQD